MTKMMYMVSGPSRSRLRAQSTFTNFNDANVTDVISKRLDNLSLSPTTRNFDGINRNCCPHLSPPKMEASTKTFIYKKVYHGQALLLGWRALWGKPYAPKMSHGLSNRCTKKPTEDVIKAHSIMERQFLTSIKIST